MKRVITGKNFEADIAITAHEWEWHHVGKLWRHGPLAHFGAGGEVSAVRGGGGHVDWTGHIVVCDCTALGSQGWHHGRCYTECNQQRIIPVAFDCKVLKAGHATYQHDKRLTHQLHSLTSAACGGSFAFLLVYAPHHHERVYILPIQRFFAALYVGTGVALWADGRDELPYVEKPTNGCDFIPILHHARPTPCTYLDSASSIPFRT